MEDSTVNLGLSERILREVIATPALKELMLLSMKDVKAETAPGLVKTLLWGDPGISMSLFGALPDAVNWVMEFLLELGRQLNGLPEPLLKDILGQVGAGIDGERLRQFPAVYGQLARRLLVGGDKSADEARAAAIAAFNSLLAGLDRITAGMDENRSDIALSIARDMRAIDTAALRRSLRRALLLAVTAARGPREKQGGKTPKVALAAAGGIAALVALRLAVRRKRGR